MKTFVLLSAPYHHDITDNPCRASIVPLLRLSPCIWRSPTKWQLQTTERAPINIHSSQSPCLNNASLSGDALHAPVYQEYKWCPCVDKKSRSKEIRGLPAGCRQHPRIITGAGRSLGVFLVFCSLHKLSGRLQHYVCRTGSVPVTLVLGEDVRWQILLPIAASRWGGAERPWVQLRQGADAQGQRRVDKRGPQVVHAEGGGGFSVQQQNFIPCFQTWRKWGGGGIFWVSTRYVWRGYTQPLWYTTTTTAPPQLAANNCLKSLYPLSLIGQDTCWGGFDHLPVI